MAKLLCVAQWPDGSTDCSEYPISFELSLSAIGEKASPPGKWLACQWALYTQDKADIEPKPLIQATGQILQRDLQRLINDLKGMLLENRTDHLTFVPVTPLFEMGISRLSDEQYRIIVWQDMSDRFCGVSGIGYQGLRFTSNRTRLMGFVRSLEADLKPHV